MTSDYIDSLFHDDKNFTTQGQINWTGWNVCGNCNKLSGGSLGTMLASEQDRHAKPAV